MGQASPAIVFLTDYGLADPFVGLCHAVIASAAPGVRVVDLTHAVRPQDIREGAALLADCLPWLPPGAIVLAVVDPGVGTDRRSVVVAAGEGAARRLFCGHDNGLLVPAAEALGGARDAWGLPQLPGRVSTFDGRDVFAPAAARLALGDDPDDVGDSIDPATLVPLVLAGSQAAAGQLKAEVVHVDGFGNLQLSAPCRLLDEAGITTGADVLLQVGAAARSATVCAAFDDVAPGGIGLLPDAFNRLQVAVNRGSAARLLGADVGDVVQVRRLDDV
jgi:S-adenosyl-L-methionine hydrolase (adenosine-forming)